MTDIPHLEINSNKDCLENKQDTAKLTQDEISKQNKLEEKASLLVKKISEIASENLTLKDKVYQQQEKYLKQEQKIRILTKDKTKLSIELKASTSFAAERSSTIKALSHEIHTIKTLVRYLLSHEFTMFYYASYHIFMLPKNFLFSNIRKPSWTKIKDPIVLGFRAFRTLFKVPLKLRQIYYYRKLKREDPLSESFKTNFNPKKVNQKMKKDLRKSWMLKQLVEKEKTLTSDFPPYLPEKMESDNKQSLKAAVILDEFSYACLSYECDMIQLDRHNWQKQLEENRFDLLLVESAWKGKDLQWKDYIGGVDHKKGSLLTNLVSAFREKNIPTVFWNKEDPPHYKHFLEATRLFDFVFTSDENRIESYKKDLGHTQIESLAFACQPIIHNPIGSYSLKQGEIAFAGSWHENKHEKRKTDMHNILRPALQYKLHIFDRMADHLLDNYIFPFEYQHTIQGYLPYQKMLTAYRRYKVFLNVNSVQNSKTMFSRRVFELMACGTNVISGYTKGIESSFGHDLVCEVKHQNDTKNHIKELMANPDKRQRQAHKAMREVLTHHTYSKRLEKVFSSVGLKTNPNKATTKRIAVIIDLHKVNNLMDCLNHYKNQTHKEKDLYIIYQKKNELTLIKKTIQQTKTTNVFLCFKEPLTSIYEVIIPMMSQIECQFITIFSERHYYGSNFLSDFILAFLYTGANIVSKKSFYTFDTTTQCLYHKSKDEEHNHTDFINESCFLAKKDLFLDPLLKENLILSSLTLQNVCKKLSYEAYTSDRFNYLEICEKISYHHLNEIQEIKSIKQAKDLVTL